MHGVMSKKKRLYRGGMMESSCPQPAPRPLSLSTHPWLGSNRAGIGKAMGEATCSMGDVKVRPYMHMRDKQGLHAVCEPNA